MEGNGGGGSGTATPAWDLGMHWAPAGSWNYPQPFAPSRDHFFHHRQQKQQEQQTWLNLGKRPCCWTGSCHVAQQPAGWGHAHGCGTGGGAGSGVAAAAEGKRKDKASTAVVPRCQVEGCHLALAGAKEYHRRHKVCEAHSKAPRVVVLGAEQRFCQQCSRFHAISEFDDAKRSCRRRLAGHNERRRKSNASEAFARSAGYPHGIGLPSSPAGALSLLSSARGGAPWLIPAAADISALSSAALDDLISENRAAILAWQFFSDRSPGGRLPLPSPAGRVLPGEVPGWHTTTTPLHAHPRGADDDDRAAGGYGGFDAPVTGHTTLDLMQTAAASADTPFRPVPGRDDARSPTKGDGDAGYSSDAWASVEGAPPGARVV